MRSNVAYVQDFNREVDIMKRLDHPHIVKLHDVLRTDNRQTVLVMELVQGGELIDYILQQEKLSEREAAKFMRQILSALKYCLENLVIHRGNFM